MKEERRKYHQLLHFYQSFPDLVMLNIIFIVFSIPVITIPASVAAKSKIFYEILDSDVIMERERKYYRIGMGFRKLFAEFRTCFFSEFKKSTAVGMLFGAAIILCMYIVVKLEPVGMAVFVKIFIVFSMLAISLMSWYAFPLLSIYHLSVSDLLSKSFQSIFLHVKGNVFAVLTFLLLTAIQFLGFPFLFPLLLLIHFSFEGYWILYFIKPGIDFWKEDLSS